MLLSTGPDYLFLWAKLSPSTLTTSLNLQVESSLYFIPYKVKYTYCLGMSGSSNIQMVYQYSSSNLYSVYIQEQTQWYLSPSLPTLMGLPLLQSERRMLVISSALTIPILKVTAHSVNSFSFLNRSHPQVACCGTYSPL